MLTIGELAYLICTIAAFLAFSGALAWGMLTTRVPPYDFSERARLEVAEARRRS